MSDNVDPYATPRASLRENVKTMSTILAGTAGAIIAGSPFSGIGALEPATLRFWLAIFGLFMVAVCLFRGWKELTFMLRPDVLDPAILRDGFDEKQLQGLGLPAAELEELVQVKREFNRRRSALLPPNINSYEKFEQFLDEEWERLDEDGSEARRAAFNAQEKNLRDIGFWATFTRLSNRTEHGLKRVQFLGAASLVALLLFAWAANPPKEQEKHSKSPIVQFVSPCPACPVAQVAPAAKRITFNPNAHVLDAGAYAVLNEAAIALRQQPGLGVLLLAHTDTVAAIRVNRELAAKRVQSTRSALQDQGGIAASRIFVSELPRSDLPVLTGPEVAQAENRSVDLLFVPLPTPQR
jgi:outer membrane protein OmpA-like peptidoglycan-associated protein